MNISFQNKVVVVTGGSTGIGAATAIAFGKAGASVVVNYNSSRKEAEDVAAKIEESGGKALVVQADVSDREQVHQLIQSTLDQFGDIDILVNNAGGLLKRQKLEEMTEDLWESVMNLNLKSVYMVSQAVLPVMKKKQAGKIVHVSSIAGRNGGGPGAAAYSASKGALITLTKSMAKEYLPYGILVNGIAPGVITTPFHDRFTAPEVRENFKKVIPLGREGKPEEIAYGILFLASSYASYIVGETLEINGGMLMH